MESNQELSKNQVKLIRSLAIKKYRIKNNLFIAEGKKILNELFNSNFTINRCFLTEISVDFEHLKNMQIISQKALSEVSLLKQPHFGLALVEMPKPNLAKVEKVNLILDGISDPGNLGTLIRLADWYGFENITCTNNCVDAFNPKVVQASMGSIFRVNVVYQQVEEINWLPRVYGTFLNGENLHSLKPEFPCQLVIGSEADGISEEIEKKCTHSITIPRIGKAESLNAAVATGIILDRFTQVAFL